MTAETWTLRRNGQARLGVVVTPEPSLLERLDVPVETWPDGQKWYLLGKR